MIDEYDEDEEPLTAEEVAELLELNQSMEELTEFMKQFRIRFKGNRL